MMRLALPLLLAAATAACSPASAPGDAAAAAPVAHTFAFFAADPDSRDPRIIDWVAGDCSEVALARVSRMPADDAVLKPDIVVEFGDDGSERRRWLKPYSAEILAIQGDDLYFGASPGGAKGPFRTSPAGEVVLATPLSTGLSERAELMSCPDTLPSFPDMSLVVCYAAQDAGGRPLNLAWDAGCP
ncbi:hypothetical protein [Arenimonas terrae]|jgi:hypothetical protein|uniref:Lipoprotein n=1 Tax=Arenimonas terrae TaxID=2546226 RepID=A0A5C4RRF6_9GAMM|nr:hypothetical protein [Arenimonas terrae]TNJ33682.1 hypothetical protein E1B00_10075 [Arenimonas terrae]